MYSTSRTKKGKREKEAAAAAKTITNASESVCQLAGLRGRKCVAKHLSPSSLAQEARGVFCPFPPFPSLFLVLGLAGLALAFALCSLVIMGCLDNDDD